MSAGDGVVPTPGWRCGDYKALATVGLLAVILLPICCRPPGRVHARSCRYAAICCRYSCMSQTSNCAGL